MPNFRDEQYISAFLFNMGLWKSKNNISLMAGKDIVSQGIKYYSNKEITFNAGQDIFLASKLIKEAAPFSVIFITPNYNLNYFQIITLF